MGMKVSIIGGGGTVGSSAAFRLAQDGFASEIVLVDPRSNVAEAHALDIEQSVAHRANLRVRAGEIGDTADSDVIVLALAVWARPPVSSRVQSLRENLRLFMEVCPPLTSQSPAASWMVVSAPHDVFISLMGRMFSIPRKRLIGVSRNDTSRLRWAIAKILSVPATDVEAYVLGEHGETQVPL